MRRGFATQGGGDARRRRRFFLRTHSLQARPRRRQSDAAMSALAPPQDDDRLPLWEVARRWAAANEAAAKTFYARLWAGYWLGQVLSGAFQVLVPGAPAHGACLPMPPAAPGRRLR